MKDFNTVMVIPTQRWRYCLFVLLLSTTQLLLSLPVSAETVINCPEQRSESRLVPDTNPSEKFRVKGCWCGATERVQNGITNLTTDPFYLLAKNTDDVDKISSEIIRVLGLSRDYAFSASRPAKAARGSSEVSCLSQKDVDRYAEVVKGDGDGGSLRTPEIVANVPKDTETGDATPGEEGSQVPDFGERDPDELSSSEDVKPTGEEATGAEVAGAQKEEANQDDKKPAASVVVSEEDKRREKAVSRLKKAQEFHSGEREGLEDAIKGAKAELKLASDRLNVLEQELKRRRRDEGIFETIDVFISGLFGSGDPAITSFENRIKAEREKIKRAEYALGIANSRLNEIVKLEGRLKLEVVKADPVTRTQEEGRRQQEAIEAQKKVYRQIEEMAVQEAEFDKVIAEIQSNGGDASKAKDTKSRYQEVKGAIVNGLNSDLQDLFTRNRRDGIGPSGQGQLAVGIYAGGEELGDVFVPVLPEEEIKRSRQMARRLAESAIFSTDQSSIFIEFNDQAYSEFSDELVGTLSEYKDDPLLFAERFFSVVRGAGRGAKDGLVGLGEVAYEVGDTGLEAIGVDSAGTENLEALEKAYRGASNLDKDAVYVEIEQFINTIDRRLAKQAGAGDINAVLADTGYLVTTIIGGEEVVFRAVAQGAKLVKITKVVDAADGVRDAARATDAATDVASVDHAADAARRARAGAETVFEPQTGRSGVAAADEFAPTNQGTPFGPLTEELEDALAAGEGLPFSEELLPLAPGQIPADLIGTQRITRGRPDGFSTQVLEALPDSANRGSSTFGPRKALPDIDSRTIEATMLDDAIRLRRTDGGGRGITLDQRKVDAGGDLLGKGSFTEAYRIPTGPEGGTSVAAKVTANVDDAVQDAFGYREMSEIDSNVLLVPQVYGRYPTVGVLEKVIENGKVVRKFVEDGARRSLVTVVDEAPAVIPATQKLSPGQVDAYRKGIAALNEKGLVFLDNHPGNYTFIDLGNDKYVLVVVDGGGTLLTKGATSVERAAKAKVIQQTIDNVPASLRNDFDEAVAKLDKAVTDKEIEAAEAAKKQALLIARYELHQKLAEFDSDIAFDRYNKVLSDDGYKGPLFKTLNSNLDGGFKYNPFNGLFRPELSTPPVATPSPGASINKLTPTMNKYAVRHKAMSALGRAA